VMYRRHLEKCAPFAKNGLRKVDTRLKIIIRITMAILMILSLSIIYFMTV
ncbi:MAG: hypothetical protein QG650_504, partial [Patescibacteria group bacterium]|nr:hypothetical protein [Patescibacteria group bacterium]